MNKRSRYRVAGQLVLLLAWSCASARGLDESGSGPTALLLSPVNATWAANNTSYWRDKGFGGFILTGIGNKPGAAPAPLEDQNKPLALELRLARERLDENGLDHNFLYTGFPPGDASFASADSAAGIVRGVRAVARLCGAAGLKGVAFDSASSSGFYDCGWDGYAYEAYAPADLARNARRFGRSLARAVLIELPGTDILIVTDGWRFSGALWLDFFNGVLEGAEMDEACSVGLLTRESFAARTPAELARIARETRAALEQRLEPGPLRLWRRQGRLSLGLAPLAWDQAAQTPRAVVDPLTFRRLVAAAQALSDGCIWVESDGSCWWRLNQQDVETYSQLRQNGPAVADQARPVVANLDAYSLRMPHDAWRFAGPLDRFGAPAGVYATDNGAALLLWSGTPGQFELPSNGQPLSVKDLASGESVECATESGATTVPASPAPLTVEGLPAWPWLVEAGLRVHVERQPAPGRAAVLVSYELRNATGLAITGTLSFLAPAGFSVNPPVTPINVPPGETVQGEVNLSGKFELGKPIGLTANLAAAGGGVVKKKLEVRAVPEVRWACRLDGDAAGNLAVYELDGKPSLEVIACTDAGEVACIGADGAIAWQRRFTASFAAKPAAGTLASGEPAVAAIDTRGRLRLLNSAGGIAWERDMGGGCLAPVFADVDEFAGQEIVLAQADGHVVVLGAGGQELRRYKPLLQIAWLGAAPGPGGKDVLIVVQTEPMGLLAVLDRTGRLRWSGIPEGPLAGAPVVGEDNQGKRLLFAATKGGVVTARDLYTGEKTARVETDIGGVRGVAAGGPGVLLTHRDGLNAYTPDLEPAWAYQGRLAAPAAADRTVVVAPAGSGLVCLDAQGREVWRSDTGPSVSGTPLIADLDVDGAPECAYSDLSRLVSVYAW